MTAKLYVLQTAPVGKVIEFDPETRAMRVLVDGMDSYPDGIAVDRQADRIYWTNMGRIKEAGSLEFFQADGSIQTAHLDGSDVHTLFGNGLFVTGKQLIHDDETGCLYWCDREGMRVFRAKDDGSDIEVMVETGVFPRDSHDYPRHCVGIAINKQTKRLYWTQKGPSKAGQGRIFSAGLEIPTGEDALTRSDIIVEMDHLPEPIDLEFSPDLKTLYWTDRGDDAKGGNSLNRADITDDKLCNHSILAKGFKETIALALDAANGMIYVTDLGGNIYRHDLSKPGSVEILASGLGSLTGITLA